MSHSKSNAIKRSLRQEHFHILILNVLVFVNLYEGYGFESLICHNCAKFEQRDGVESRLTPRYHLLRTCCIPADSECAKHPTSYWKTTMKHQIKLELPLNPCEKTS